MMHVPKRKPRQECRLKQREQIKASPLMTRKFTGLKTLKVRLEYFDATGTTKNGEMKCKLNVAHARSAVWFACPGWECVGGGWLTKAVAGRRKVASGQLRRLGTRKRGRPRAGVVPDGAALQAEFGL